MVSIEKFKKLKSRIERPENSELKKKIDLGTYESDNSYMISSYTGKIIGNLDTLEKKLEYIKTIKNDERQYLITKREIDGIDSFTSALIDETHRHMDAEGWVK